MNNSASAATSESGYFVPLASAFQILRVNR